MAKRHYFFAGGGTGGHIYPAIAVAEQLKLIEPDCEITFLCSQRSIDYYILSKTSFNFIPIPAKGLSMHPIRLIKFLYMLMYGKQIAVNILEKVKDNATVIGVGGFASAPVVLAAKKLKIPVDMINVDIIPGKANKFLARYASRIFVQFDETTKHFGGNSKKVEVVGCPLRSSFNHPNPESAIESLGLDRDKKVLLVTGASMGAQNINDAMLSIVGNLKGFANDWQIVNLTGSSNFDAVKDAYADTEISCKVVNYYDEMSNLYAASEIIIGRAGAVSIAEFAVAGKPVICLPYPYHKDKHQYLNAAQLVQHGAAVIVDDLPNDKAKTAKDLFDVLNDLMASEDKRNAMKQAALKAAKPAAAKTIANQISGIEIKESKNSDAADKRISLNDTKWWEEHERLWKELVPEMGQADTVQGELIRCSGKMTDEAYRNGNMNWESGYEKLVQYVGDKLNDPNTFSVDEIKKISEAVESIIRDFDMPDTSGHGSSYYYLNEMAVRWCLANPKDIPHKKDPSLIV